MELINHEQVTKQYTDMEKKTYDVSYDLYTLATQPGLADIITKDVQRTFNLKGFRKGKVPRSVLEKQIGTEQLYGPRISPLWDKFCAENRLYIGVKSVIENIKVRVDGAVVFSVMTLAYPDLNLDIKEKYEIDASDEIIHLVGQEINCEREKKSILKPVEDRASIWGDVVVIDFVGKIGGTTDQDLDGKDVEIKIGSRLVAIPGFENELIDMKVGDTKSFSLQVPENYDQILRNNPRAKHLSGKTVNFEATMKRISLKITPSDKDLAESNGFDSFEKWYYDLADKAVAAAQQDKEKVSARLIDKIIEGNEDLLANSMPRPILDTKIYEFMDRNKDHLDKMSEQEKSDALKRIGPGLVKSIYQEAVVSSLLKKAPADVNPVQEEIVNRARSVVMANPNMKGKNIEEEVQKILMEHYFAIYREVQRFKLTNLHSDKLSLILNKESEAWKTAMSAVQQSSASGQPVAEILDTAEKVQEKAE